MSESEHDDVTRRSFERQVGLFVGADAPFARRASAEWFGQLDPDRSRSRRSSPTRPTAAGS